MATVNSDVLPLPELKAVIDGMKKRKDELDVLNSQLKQQSRLSGDIWQDRKGEEFRAAVKQMTDLNERVLETMDRQLKVLTKYYDIQTGNAQNTHFPS